MEKIAKPNPLIYDIDYCFLWFVGLLVVVVCVVFVFVGRVWATFLFLRVG